MKSLKSKLILLFAAVAMTSSVFAQGFLQDPKWGADEESRKANALTFNFFKDAYNAKDFDKGAAYMHELLEKAPKAHQNIYIYGINIYRNRIARATSVAEKKLALDTLMTIYDLRAVHFGDHAERGSAYIHGQKARDYLVYNPMDRDGVRKHLKVAIEEAGPSVELDLVNIYFKELVDDYKADLIEVGDLMGDYDKYTPIFEADQSPEGMESKKTFDALFVSSGAANCDNLETLFKDKIAANPTDLALIEKTVALLSRGNCTGEFFVSTAEKLHAVKPSAQTAMVLASAFEEKKDYAKSIKYLNEAIANTTNPTDKSNLCMRIAGSEVSAGNSANAAKFARQAIDLNPSNPYAYMILAQAYAMGATSCTDFNRLSAYWLAYDAAAEARRLMPENDPQIVNVNGQMNAYRAAFPTSEECFFRGLSDGAAYTVSCGWVSGRTTVRTRQ